MYQNPILLIGFNRPDIIQSVIKRIEEIKPSKLYVAIDGPRKNIIGEALKCQAVLEAINNISWPGEVKYKVRDTNAGCKINVTEAISWVLSENDDVVILEDDIVPSVVFFDYVSLLLEKYRNDNRVAMISANQYTPIEGENDYVFTKYGHIWGWATWKRVWSNFDVNVPCLENEVNNGLPSMSFENDIERKYFKKYYLTWLNKIKNNNENAWGPQFSFFRRQNGLLSIAPRVNLASNIGNVSSRSDSVSLSNENYYPAVDNFKLIKHPLNVECNLFYDKYHFKKHINRKTHLLKRILRKIVLILKFK